MQNSSPQPTTPRRQNRRVIGLAAVGGPRLRGLARADGVAAAAPPDPAAACDGPGWRVASASVDGAPAGFDAGDAGDAPTYGTTTAGTCAPPTSTMPPTSTPARSPPRPARPSSTSTRSGSTPPTTCGVDDHQVLHYSFVTHAGIDGIDFARELRLTMLRDAAASTRTMICLTPSGPRTRSARALPSSTPGMTADATGRDLSGDCAAIPSARTASCPPGSAGSPHRSAGPSSTPTVARSTCACGAPTDPGLRHQLGGPGLTRCRGSTRTAPRSLRRRGRRSRSTTRGSRG